MTYKISKSLFFLSMIWALLSCSTVVNQYVTDNQSTLTTLAETITETSLQAQMELFPELPRHVLDARSSHVAVEENIRQQMEAYGYDVSTQNVTWNYNSSSYSMNNIIVKKTGSNPSNRPIIISAHWDTVQNSPGIVDNASGCVAMLEVARLLQGQTTVEDIYFVFYAFEEVYYEENNSRIFLGSQTYLNELKSQNSNPKLVINMDMIAYTTDKEPEPNAISWAIDWPTVGNHIFVFGLKSYTETSIKMASLAKNWIPNLKFHSMNVSLEQVQSKDIFSSLQRSDHYTYWKENINTIFITNSDLRFPHYHETTDTKDKVDYTFLKRVTQWIFYVSYLESNNN